MFLSVPHHQESAARSPTKLARPDNARPGATVEAGDLASEVLPVVPLLEVELELVMIV